jgi:6-phosphogluconate dehydrogenase
MTTHIAIIGLGKMGGNMARRLSRAGIKVQGFDPLLASNETFRNSFSAENNLALHHSLEACISATLNPEGQPSADPAIVWIMLPAGQITQNALDTLRSLMRKGDVLVEGGNSNYLESQARAEVYQELGLHFVDCGVSGGVWGLQNGYCLMFGGAPEAARIIAPVIQALAPTANEGWLHCGPSGAGHFVKMIHNGIEYGMMQALAEGFALLNGNPALSIPLGGVAQLWQHGSVVRSWLLDLTADALKNPQALSTVGPLVPDSGEGRWTIDEAIRQGTPAPVIAASLMSRFDSQGKADTANKLLALMRQGFGGHAITKA